MFQQFSPNMLKTFELCPRKFYFQYVKNLSMPLNDKVYEFGKNIHAIASYYLKGENIDKLEKSLTQKESEVWQYLKSVEYFSYKVINTEYYLAVKIGKYFYGGRLDALAEKDGHYYILDYKTGGAPKNPELDFQTIIYLLAVKDFFKTDNVTFVYIDLKNKSEVKIDLKKEVEEEYTARLTETSNKIEKYEASKRKQNCKCEYDVICY